MFALADSRFVLIMAPPGILGVDYMFSGLLASELGVATPRHGKGYNVVACDGHVDLVERSVLFDPSKSGQHWNNDHEPHPELW